MNFYPYNHNNIVATEGDLCVLSNASGRLCGYCSFAADELPKEWHGDYSADGLQYLSVHGGITYCEVAGDNDEERYKVARAAHDAIPQPDGSLPLDERLKVLGSRRQAFRDALPTVPYSHVVFGFDCAHYRDDEDPSLSDPQHVLELARQMRQQIAAHAKTITEWREANRDSRLSMIDSIRATADTPVELGFGGLIGALAGGEAFGEQATEH
jgi:hypothetical protein